MERSGLVGDIREPTSVRRKRGRPLIEVGGEEVTDVSGNRPVHLNAANLTDYVLPKGGASVREVMQESMAAAPGYTIGLTGQPVITVEEMDSVKRDTWFTAGLAFAGVSLLTLLVFRWKAHALLVLGTLAAGLAWSFGAVRLELGYLNLITSSFISTLVGVGIAYAIHPVSEYELAGVEMNDEVIRLR